MVVSFYNNGIYTQSTMNSNDLYNLLDNVDNPSLLHICDMQFDDNDWGDYKYQEFKDDTDLSFAIHNDIEPTMFVVLGESQDGSIKRYIVDADSVLRGKFKVYVKTICQETFLPDFIEETITLDCLLGNVNLSKDFASDMDRHLCW